LAFLTQNKAKLCEKLIITLVLKKNANFFAKNIQKSPKIVIITSVLGQGLMSNLCKSCSGEKLLPSNLAGFELTFHELQSALAETTDHAAEAIDAVLCDVAIVNVWNILLCNGWYCLYLCLNPLEPTIALSRGRCYDHNFLRFSTIFGEKIGVFLKNQCYDQNFA
jgi:hypothetical protein